jgi:hypothetical protein
MHSNISAMPGNTAANNFPKVLSVLSCYYACLQFLPNETLSKKKTLFLAT